MYKHRILSICARPSHSAVTFHSFLLVLGISSLRFAFSSVSALCSVELGLEAILSLFTFFSLLIFNFDMCSDQVLGLNMWAHDISWTGYWSVGIPWSGGFRSPGSSLPWPSMVWLHLGFWNFGSSLACGSVKWLLLVTSDFCPVLVTLTKTYTLPSCWPRRHSLYPLVL